MPNQDLQIKLIVSAKPEAVFQAINNVRGWWSEEITGSTVQLNDKFNYNFEDVHRCEIKIITSIPNKMVEWYQKQLFQIYKRQNRMDRNNYSFRNYCKRK